MPISEFRSGYAIGRWAVPADGFHWRNDLKVWVVPGSDLDPPFPDPGPWLVGKGPLRSYALLRRGNLLRAFVTAAADPRPETVLAFSDRWGHLEHPLPLVPLSGNGELQFGESVTQWQAAAAECLFLYRGWQDVQRLAHGDSYGPTVLSESRRRLHEAVFRRPGSIKIVDSESDAFPTRQWHVVQPVEADQELADRLAKASDAQVFGFFVAREINRHLEDVHPAVLPFIGGEMRLVPAGLLAAIYLRFAQEFGPTGSSGLPEQPCLYCLLPFMPTRRDKVYCSGACREAARYRRNLRRGGES